MEILEAYVTFLYTGINIYDSWCRIRKQMPLHFDAREGADIALPLRCPSVAHLDLHWIDWIHCTANSSADTTMLSANEIKQVNIQCGGSNTLYCEVKGEDHILPRWNRVRITDVRMITIKFTNNDVLECKPYRIEPIEFDDLSDIDDGMDMYLLSNGSRYAIDFKELKRLGEGAKRKCFGWSHSCKEWINGRPHGIGIIDQGNGDKISGTWSYGELQSGAFYTTKHGTVFKLEKQT